MLGNESQIALPGLRVFWVDGAGLALHLLLGARVRDALVLEREVHEVALARRANDRKVGTSTKRLLDGLRRATQLLNCRSRNRRRTDPDKLAQGTMLFMWPYTALALCGCGGKSKVARRNAPKSWIEIS